MPDTNFIVMGNCILAGITAMIVQFLKDREIKLFALGMEIAFLAMAFSTLAVYGWK